MLKQTQKFTFKDETGERHFLLMPGEVEEIKNYLVIFPEKSLIDAFLRFTGKSGTVFEVKLIVEFY